MADTSTQNSISIRCSCGSCNEWGMLELQGELQGMSATTEVDVGELCSMKGGDTFTLTIGYHELEGTIEKVKKPLVVMQKVKGDDGTRYDVVGVIRKKLAFTKRPKPIISKLG